jgi:hypothetical protein
MADDETIPPSASTPEPDSPSPANHIALSGKTMVRGTVSAGMDSRPDTPLPARAEADAAIGLGWH